ncbi:hypothetical protein YC2023_110237 [Brassica napus]
MVLPKIKKYLLMIDWPSRFHQMLIDVLQQAFEGIMRRTFGLEREYVLHREINQKIALESSVTVINETVDSGTANMGKIKKIWETIYLQFVSTRNKERRESTEILTRLNQITKRVVRGVVREDLSEPGQYQRGLSSGADSKEDI